MTTVKRKGSKSAKDIPKEVLVQLNNGQIETANLVEWLAVDQKILLENLLEQVDRTTYLQPILLSLTQLKNPTVNKVNEAIGMGLLAIITAYNDTKLFEKLATHTSDLVRCWATYVVGRNAELPIKEKLQQIQLFAADKHFGVREIAWLAVRPTIAKNLTESISILSEWTSHQDESIRRFASEATRPRGVWCEHIEELKRNPQLGLPILEPLKSDSAKYVQDSIGNWLNDASKTKPDFVAELCKKWSKESGTKETAYITKKAMRTITNKAMLLTPATPVSGPPHRIAKA